MIVMWKQSKKLILCENDYLLIGEHSGIHFIGYALVYYWGKQF
jgi:hypothetical protein